VSVEGTVMSSDMHVGFVLGMFAGMTLIGALHTVASLCELVAVWWRGKRGGGS
jgi:hypothetical protein